MLLLQFRSLKDSLFFLFDELMGSSQVHEARVNRSLEKNKEEKGFQAKGDASSQKYGGGFHGRDRGRE